MDDIKAQSAEPPMTRAEWKARQKQIAADNEASLQQQYEDYRKEVRTEAWTKAQAFEAEQVSPLKPIPFNAKWKKYLTNLIFDLTRLEHQYQDARRNELEVITRKGVMALEDRIIDLEAAVEAKTADAETRK